MTFLEFFEALVGCAEIFVTHSMIKDPYTPREPGVDYFDYDSVAETEEETKGRERSDASSLPEISTTPNEDAVSLATSTAAVTVGELKSTLYLHVY